jgi:hypothetical protein
MSHQRGCRRVGALLITQYRFAIVAVALVAVGCSSDGSTGVGSGQDPDPVILDFPIAYTKGPLFDDQMQQFASPDFRDQTRFHIGTDLYFRDRASPSSDERNLTFDVTQGLGDVQGVEISVDGTTVLFAMRGPFDPNLNDDEQPTWNIWEYDITGDTLRRIIDVELTAEAGQDISPHYLPDGRIIFSSTRQRQQKAMLLDEGKPQFDAEEEDRGEAAYVLHVMDSDGGNIHQVSFNQSHDFDPSVLDDGRVLFSRWDNSGNVNGVHLYRMNPDGTQLELLYGAESHATGTDQSEVQFIGARELPDGRVMAIARPAVHPELGGDIVIIDTPNFVENTQPVVASAGMPGPAQVSATPLQVRTDLLPSRGGRFASAFPLWDGTDRVLVSWNICRVVDVDGIILPCSDERLADPTAQLAPPLYGIWMYDPLDQTQLPIVIGEEGMLIGDIVAAQPRSNPAVILDKMPITPFEVELANEDVGILNIRSVYDVDGISTAFPDIETLADPALTLAADRAARFIRVEKAVPLPGDDVLDFADTAFGRSQQQGMREILAYAPVEPDGSVRVKVPARVPFAVSVLDANGRRITQRHQNWMQVLPGDELRCNGCHDATTGLSHGRSDTFVAVYAGAQATGVPFPNTDPTLFTDFGETMAETRTRLSCVTDCAALDPGVDIVYEDVWTDETAAGRAADASFTYSYFDLTTPAPTTPECAQSWSAGCRIVINYEQHIHPLWSAARMSAAQDVTCAQSGCHAPVDAANNPQMPGGQLDLSDGPSPDEADHYNSYRELLFDDTAVDAAGAPIAGTTVSPAMSVVGANASTPFFSMFDPGGNHEGYLSPAELKLIAEWLDIGAQYFNNPHDPDVPLN